MYVGIFMGVCYRVIFSVLMQTPVLQTVGVRQEFFLYGDSWGQQTNAGMYAAYPGIICLWEMVVDCKRQTFKSWSCGQDTQRTGSMTKAGTSPVYVSFIFYVFFFFRLLSFNIFSLIFQHPFYYLKQFLKQHFKVSSIVYLIQCV